MIKVGDKVVCVKSHPNAASGVERGRIYTIESIHLCPYCGMVHYKLACANTFYNERGLLIGTDCINCGVEITSGFCVFGAFRFRPVEYPKLSYSEIARAEVKEGTDIQAEVREKELCN